MIQRFINHFNKYQIIIKNLLNALTVQGVRNTIVQMGTRGIYITYWIQLFLFTFENILNFIFIFTGNKRVKNLLEPGQL